MHADLFSRHASPLEVYVLVAVDDRGDDVMSDEIYCRCNGQQQRRRRGGRSVQLPGWVMILHSSSRQLCKYTYVLRTTNIFSENKRETPSGGHVSGWTCRTCAQKFRVYLLKTAWTFGLSCGKKLICFPTETPDHFRLFSWPVVGGNTFSPLAPILGPEKKRSCHPRLLFVGVNMIPNTWYITFE